jgi:hypothetical protein
VKLDYLSSEKDTFKTWFLTNPKPVPPANQPNPDLKYLTYNNQSLDPQQNQIRYFYTQFAETFLDNGTGSVSLPSGGTGAIGSGGTHFENLWADFQTGGNTGASWLKGSGDGTSSSPKGVILLVTDGADNPQTFTPSGSFAGGSVPQPPPQSPPQPLAQDFCLSAQKAGYTVGVLLIPYVAIPDTQMNNNAPQDVLAMQVAGVNPPATPSPIQQRMQACASKRELFIVASTPQAISDGIQQLFKTATDQARLTQ